MASTARWCLLSSAPRKPEEPERLQMPPSCRDRVMASWSSTGPPWGAQVRAKAPVARASDSPKARASAWESWAWP
ncbi:hypothetical protein VT50_0221410 [Streptomyces antioxidans]|uniref:Uncharacterized protein n=1 Tax=Streptomyces antioxidans TaxID=1507734 RepID=A0A1V4D2V1_9ACTN|nr:hypothetical protein VT50_0221410 [Streptomyces antioxidans]